MKQVIPGLTGNIINYVNNAWGLRCERGIQYQGWVQLHKIASITITLKYQLHLQLQLHHVHFNYNYSSIFK